MVSVFGIIRLLSAKFFLSFKNFITNMYKYDKHTFSFHINNNVHKACKPNIC